MKKLEINITKAILTSYTVSIGKEGPNVSATIQLMTDAGKKITSYSVSTDAWKDSDKLKLPSEAIGHMAALANLLEVAVVQHCRQGQGALAAGVDEPFSLNDIPF